MDYEEERSYKVFSREKVAWMELEAVLCPTRNKRCVGSSQGLNQQMGEDELELKGNGRRCN